VGVSSKHGGNRFNFYHNVRHGDGVMTSLTSQDGKLVLRDGSLGTGQECCCSDAIGACCYCELAQFEFQSGGGNDEETANAIKDAQNAAIAATAAALTNGGYCCVVSEDAVVVFNADNNAFEVQGGIVGGRCCGSRDGDVIYDPSNNEFGGNAGDGAWQDGVILACVETDPPTILCSNGDSEELCSQKCGTFNPGQDCQAVVCDEVPENCNPLP
jgi:hypothetical protein